MPVTALANDTNPESTAYSSQSLLLPKICASKPPMLLLQSPEVNLCFVQLKCVGLTATLGSPEAVGALLAADTHSALLSALSALAPNDPLALKLSITKAFKTIVVACADIIGPSLWGLSEELEISYADPARVTLDQAFQVIHHITTHIARTHIDILQMNNLDIFLPLLSDPSPLVAALVANLLASCLRIPSHQKAATSWQPPSERPGSGSRRGWETAALKSPMRGGGWIARQLALLLESNDSKAGHWFHRLRGCL